MTLLKDNVVSVVHSDGEGAASLEPEDSMALLG